MTEYYLIKEKLSFIFEQHYSYNRPIYYDAKTAKEDNDEAFDFKKSKRTETRSYFDNDKLILQLGNPKNDDPALTEQELIKQFDWIMAQLLE